MKRNRPWLKLAAALGTGGLAGYLALTHLDGGPQTSPPETPSARSMVVAARDLPVGTVVSAEDLKTVAWASPVLPPGYVANPDEVVGHGLLTEVRAEEPILTTRLAGSEAGRGLPVLIPHGKRALSVRVDDVIAVAGFVVPGTRVDVLVTLNPGTERSGTITRMILQNVPVLAAGQSMQADRDGSPQQASVITLEVTPEEAELLTLASTEGRIQLALRSTNDAAMSQTDGAGVSRIATRNAPAAPAEPVVRRAAPRQPAHVVEIYSGSNRTVAAFH